MGSGSHRASGVQARFPIRVETEAGEHVYLGACDEVAQARLLTFGMRKQTDTRSTHTRRPHVVVVFVEAPPADRQEPAAYAGAECQTSVRQTNTSLRPPHPSGMPPRARGEGGLLAQSLLAFVVYVSHRIH